MAASGAHCPQSRWAAPWEELGGALSPARIHARRPGPQLYQVPSPPQRGAVVADRPRRARQATQPAVPSVGNAPSHLSPQHSLMKKGDEFLVVPRLFFSPGYFFLLSGG